MRNRNIAEILEDDRNGKQLSQTEQRVATAYTQGKYDAVRELKLDNNSNTNEVLNKIKAEIEQLPSELTADGRRMIRRGNVFSIIYKYIESEVSQ